VLKVSKNSKTIRKYFGPHFIKSYKYISDDLLCIMKKHMECMNTIKRKKQWKKVHQKFYSYMWASKSISTAEK